MNLIREMHSRGLGEHFGIYKATTLVRKRYFWPIINKDVKNFVKCCKICQLGKGRTKNKILYTPLLVSKRPWEDICVDFVMGLPKM